jgi:Cu/Ag efflux protein CusF
MVLLNLALALGLGLGYLAWGREAARLDREMAALRAEPRLLAAEQTFTARGVVRTLIAEINVVVLSHEEIAGFMPAMTMGFRAQDPRLWSGLEAGDVVRFTLRGVPPNMVITEIVKVGKS